MSRFLNVAPKTKKEQIDPSKLDVLTKHVHKMTWETSLND